MLHELSEAEFLATFSTPMERLQPEEVYRPVSIADYVKDCISYNSLNYDRVEIEHVYLSADRKYTHVLLSYGIEDSFIVIVLLHPADCVLGHRFIDLKEMYGVE